MTGFGISIDSSSVAAGFKRLSAALTNLQPIFAEIGPSLVTSTQQRFENQADPTGKPWQPLSPVTILQRLGGPKKVWGKRGKLRAAVLDAAGSLKILVRRGHLRNSITFNATANSLTVGSPLVYARIQFLGGQAGRGHKVTIPARQALGLDDSDNRLIVAKIQRFLAQSAGSV